MVQTMLVVSLGLWAVSLHNLADILDTVADHLAR